MSIQLTTNQIASVEREMQYLEQQIHDIEKRIVTKQKEITTILEKVHREKDIKRIISYQKEITSKQNEAARFEKDKSTKNKSLSDKRKKRAGLIISLAKEEKTGRDKISKTQQAERDKAKREQKEILSIQRQISEEMGRQKVLSLQSVKNIHEEMDKIYDVFVSHASEDKDSFVRPFVETLLTLGLQVWYDEFQLQIGDSLRRKIDKGLANSKFGIVILSKHFFSKEWPQRELDGLFAREVNGEQVILPIWHEISKNEVLKFSPTIADLVALNTSAFTIQEIAEKIAEKVLSGNP